MNRILDFQPKPLKTKPARQAYGITSMIAWAICLFSLLFAWTMPNIQLSIFIALNGYIFACALQGIASAVCHFVDD